MYLSTHCQAAVGRLQEAFEHYRLTNYQQELPTRFKKDMIKECSLTGPSTTVGKTAGSPSTMISTTPSAGTVVNGNNDSIVMDDQTIAVYEIEQLLRNIGAFGGTSTNCSSVTHDDVELIVSEHSSATTCTSSTMMHNINQNHKNNNPAGEPIRADQIL